MSSVQPLVDIPWDQNSIPATANPLSAESIDKIHRASLEVLSRTGFHFASKQALDIFKTHGFRIEGERVFFAEEQILKALESIPRRFTILARNPENHISMEPGVQSFGMGRGAVFSVNPDGSYHRGNKTDLIEAAKLCQSLDLLEHWGPLFYPYDVGPTNLYLWMCQAMIKYGDKPYLYMDIQDIDLIALAYGTSRQEMFQRSDLDFSYGQSTGMVQSPLTMSADNCDSLIEYARCGIALHIASMPIAGTTGPCTLAGLVVQQNCENLAPLVLTQLVRPGCPVFFGAIGGRADMMSLTPRFGSAEARLIEQAGVQMAHFYGLCCRGGAGLTDAPSCDFQAGAQGMLHMLAVLRDGPEFLPACGLLGSYVGGSLAKVVLDVEMITQARRFLTPLQPNPEDLAVDVMDDVGPGGHFLEHPHTLSHYRSEFLVDSIFQSLTYENWTANGKKEAVQLAHENALQLINAYERPSMDSGLEAEIDVYVERHWVEK